MFHSKIACAICVVLASASYSFVAQASTAAKTEIKSIDLDASGNDRHLLYAEASEGRPAALKYQFSNDAGATWSPPVDVELDHAPLHKPHRGNDPQIAGHGRNRVAVWTSPGSGTGGSGPLATALSSDGGKTWQAGPNPADDGGKGSHSYAALTADRDGIFHLVWLDERQGERGLRYAYSSDSGKSWSKNVTIDQATCECCQNALAVTGSGGVVALYRERSPRDMVAVVSHDRGKTWQRSTAVGDFGWQFKGCPHMGGGLAAPDDNGSKTLYAAVWTGKKKSQGAYVVRSTDAGKSWGAKLPMGQSARHPQVAAGPDGSVAFAWTEEAGGKSAVYARYSRDGGESWSKRQRLSPAGIAAFAPLLTPASAGFLAYWTEERDELQSMASSTISLPAEPKASPQRAPSLDQARTGKDKTQPAR